MPSQPKRQEPDNENERNAEIVQLHATEALESDLAGTPAPAYSDVTDNTTIKRLPVIPVPLQKENIKGTVEQAAGLGWHRVRYHGFRSPVYLVIYLVRVARGAAVLTGRLITWWHWIDGHVLVSQAVAAGRPGHQHAMSAHTEGRRVRKSRGQIIAVCLAFILIAGLVLAKFAPWWGWALCAVVAAAVLERHGRKPSKPLVRPAVVAPAYQPPTPQVITHALDSLHIKQISDLVASGRGLTFISDPHRDGPGWTTMLDLPHGVTATQILARREQLASGLRRPLSATWPVPVPHEHPGRLELWVGFQDASKVKPPLWPLLKAGQASVFDPFPFGADPRGRTVDGALFEHNWLVGSAPGAGEDRRDQGAGLRDRAGSARRDVDA
jgi:DNA segregation ATPase FtsK/SpoIIIE, S-DNA-T family